MEESVQSECVPSTSAIASLRKDSAINFHEHKMIYLKEEHEMKMRILQVKLDMKLGERAMIPKR